jgi:hypothetical protein
MPTIPSLHFFQCSPCVQIFYLLAWILFWGIRKSRVVINQKFFGGGGYDSGIHCFAKNRFIDTTVWGLALSCKRNQIPLAWNWGLTRPVRLTKRDNTSSSIIRKVIRLKSVQKLSRRVFERLLYVHCVRHLPDFYGRPEILHTVQKPVYEREHYHHKTVLIRWRVSVAGLPVLKQNLMFALCSINMNCNNDLHGTKP